MDIRDWLEENPSEKITLDVREGDVVTDMVVLVRLQRLDSTNDALIIGCTENTGGIVQLGLIATAHIQVEDWMTHGDEAE